MDSKTGAFRYPAICYGELLLVKKRFDLSFELWEVIDYYAPYNILRDTVVAMADIVACINNLACIRDFDVGILLKDAVCRFAYYLDVALYAAPKE